MMFRLIVSPLLSVLLTKSPSDTAMRFTKVQSTKASSPRHARNSPRQQNNYKTKIPEINLTHRPAAILSFIFGFLLLSQKQGSHSLSTPISSATIYHAPSLTLWYADLVNQQLLSAAVIPLTLSKWLPLIVATLRKCMPDQAWCQPACCCLQSPIIIKSIPKLKDMCRIHVT